MAFAVGALLIAVVVLLGAIAVLWVDRTRHARAELALRQSEERFHLLAERAPVIIWSARADTTLDYVNTTLVEFTGLSLEKLLDEGWLNAVHPDDVDHCRRTISQAFETRRPFLMEFRLRRSDGVYRSLLGSGVPKLGQDGGFTGYLGSSVDITEWRAAEERVESSHREIQQMAGRLIDAQDAERARVARDLHDDVSQQLAGLSIAFSGLRRRMEEARISDDLQADVLALHHRTTTLAQNVRDLSHDLHPTVLRHAGLVAALTSYCSELERANGMVVSFSAEGDFGSLSPRVALCLYRVAQEALRNVIAHAGTSRVEVRLGRVGDNAEITIADDGKGFDSALALDRGEGLGLISITERVKLLRGSLNVVTAPGQGTQVRAQIPAGSPPKSEPRSAAAILDTAPLYEESLDAFIEDAPPRGADVARVRRSPN